MNGPNSGHIPVTIIDQAVVICSSKACAVEMGQMCKVSQCRSI